MQQVKLMAIYTLAQGISKIKALKTGDHTIDAIRIFTPAHWLLGHLFKGQPIPLKRCIPFAEILDKTLVDLTAKFQADGQMALVEEDVTKLQYASAAFEQYLAHEVDVFEVFYVPPKGTHSTLKLIEHADENLSPDVRSRLSADTVNDLRQAGRCLALDAPTAAAFHLFRAVETLIQAYHAKLVSKTLSIKSRNWGAYIRDLKAHNADKGVTGYLEHIKDHYRNPIMHPEITVSSDDALSLFGAALSAISQLDAVIK